MVAENAQNTVTPPQGTTAILLLSDGTYFFGKLIGKSSTTLGELCFNTAMTGYQEIITDPSYKGQLITFTFPHIGNVGVNEEDIESAKPVCQGIIVREPITEPSNFRAKGNLVSYLKAQGLTGISNIDTRALTIHIRNNGAQNALIHPFEVGSKTVDLAPLMEALRQYPVLKGMELASGVSTQSNILWKESTWKLDEGYGASIGEGPRVVVVDYGVKSNILRSLANESCDITVVPATATAKEIFALNPHGILLSNGPGDPAATGEYAIPVIQALLDADIPLFGICMGHQLLALAVGAKTVKMHQGHHGANHPVKQLKTGKVEITSQNHGFAVDIESLPEGVVATHISLFDQTLQGLAIEGKYATSVQYHPESSPGPHDSKYLFTDFVKAAKQYQKVNRNQGKQYA